MYTCLVDHVLDWKLRILLGMTEAGSVNLKSTHTHTHTWWERGGNGNGGGDERRTQDGNGDGSGDGNKGSSGDGNKESSGNEGRNDNGEGRGEKGKLWFPPHQETMYNRRPGTALPHAASTL